MSSFQASWFLENVKLEWLPAGNALCSGPLPPLPTAPPDREHPCWEHSWGSSLTASSSPQRPSLFHPTSPEQPLFESLDCPPKTQVSRPAPDLGREPEVCI